MQALLSDGRRAAYRRCLTGRCGEVHEAPMICLGEIAGQPCPQRVHGVACLGLSRGHASLGCFRCTACFVRAMVPSVSSPDESHPSWRHAESTSMLEMSQGAEATGASWSDYIQLETAFVLGVGAVTGIEVLPRDSAAVFMCMLTWLVADKERARSLDSIFRTAGAVMAKTRGKNLTTDPRVKAFYSSLRELHGEEGHPRTAATRRMVRIILERLVDEVIGASSRARVRLMIALEVMCGLRVGEVMSGGDFHGVQANHVVILTNLSNGAESVEVLLEHSKTKHKRWVNAVSVSEGAARVRLADHLRAYWRECGFTIATRLEGGYRVEGPDYSVLRVSLIGLVGAEGKERFALLCRVLSRSADPEVRRWAAYSLLRGEQRRSATGSMDKRYINVTGGAHGCSSIATACMELERAGFTEGAGILSVIPGPLMRATHGATLGAAHMPLSTQSTYESLHALMERAHLEANPAGDPDPELDLQGLSEPLWGHHSFRRFADTVARQTMEETGASEQDIDIVFGWMEAFYSAKMQMHYETKLIREKRSAVTRLI